MNAMQNSRKVSQGNRYQQFEDSVLKERHHQQADLVVRETNNPATHPVGSPVKDFPLSQKKSSAEDLREWP